MPITGTKRVREVSDEAVHGQSPGKRLCRYSPEMMHVVRSDQVGPVTLCLCNLGSLFVELKTISKALSW